MSRALIILNTAADRLKAVSWAQKLPWGTRIEFKETKRSVPQNDRMWAMLTDISTQLTWRDQRYTPDDWKDYFMHALRKARWMPDEDGGMVPIGMRTSDLSKAEMGDLMDLMEAFGARHGVEFLDGQGASGVSSPARAA